MGRRRHFWFAVALLGLAALASPAWAGMPAPYTLKDIPRMRLEAISFFLAVLLASGGVVQWVWNGLRRSFGRLPRLNDWRAVGLVVLWGLLFAVVLTMISGARELMTPGAWEQKGATYRLKSGGN